MLIEVNAFALAPGADEAAFLAADKRVQASMSSQPGFVRRTTARGEGTAWLVLTFWSSREDADRAEASVDAEFIALIDPASVRRARFNTLD